MDRLVSRRGLLGGFVGSVFASAMAPSAGAANEIRSTGAASGTAHHRSAEALQLRLEAARFEQQFPVPAQVSNQDETRWPNRIGSFSKGLPHDARGEVLASAYQSLLDAVEKGAPEAFDQIHLGGGERLVNPQAGLAFELHGADSHALAMPPAPGFDSAGQAAEIAENYWMALLRDVPFSQYAGHPLAGRAAQDLSRFQQFPGPRISGAVTPATLFRGPAPGDLTGPYISQFLWQRTPFGAEEVDRRMRTAQSGLDYMTSYPEWLAVQNGTPAPFDLLFDGVLRFIRNGRDLAVWVRNDVIFQAYFNAMLILLDRGVALDDRNPYRGSPTQRGFGTFGEPHIASALCAVTTRALKTVWFQKWFVHRRLRPEAFAGRIHNHVTNAAVYPIHPEILASAVLGDVASRAGTYLLPMAYPEGSPLHPSYGAGHATVAGACVTVLKAFFDESAEIPDPVQASDNGLDLVPYTGSTLTVGGELNKLASNVAFGRNIAGVHWRTDASESLRLGEEVALRYLAEERMCFNERFDGFSLTRFDGTPVVV